MSWDSRGLVPSPLGRGLHWKKCVCSFWGGGSVRCWHLAGLLNRLQRVTSQMSMSVPVALCRVVWTCPCQSSPLSPPGAH